MPGNIRCTRTVVDMAHACGVPVEGELGYVPGVEGTGAETMIAEGRRVLSTIPGVRKVFTGKTVQNDAQYRYTWLVRFCHPTVIDSYREHPDHVTFADKLFRPVAGERISIDYQIVDPVIQGSSYVGH